MKIALLLSGEMRHFELAAKSYMKFFSDADVYVYTCRKDKIKLKNDTLVERDLTESYIRKFYGENLKAIRFFDDVDSDYVEEKRRAVEDLRNLYRRVDLNTFENQHFVGNVKVLLTKEGSWLENTRIDQYLKFKYCFLLMKESNQKYDIVIRMRPDTVILGNFVLENESVLCFPYPNNENIVDFMFGANMEDMEILADVYKKMGHYIFDQCISFESTEYQLEMYIKEFGMKIHYSKNMLPFCTKTAFLHTIDTNPFKEEILQELETLNNNLPYDYHQLRIFFLYFKE